VATGAHIAIIAHVTGEELRRYLDTTEMVNGFANRFLWFCVKRSKSIADDDARRIDPAKLAPLVERLHRAVDFARTVHEMRRDDEACEDWRKVYPILSAGKPGLLGAATSRGEAQVMRLALIYALLDCSQSIGRRHLRAALALWTYAEDSARFIFGDALGDPTADAILDALRRNALGLTRTEISGLFSRNKPGSEISRALRSLAEVGAVRTVMGDSGGRPSERWIAL
jgi:hypothetical protein